MKVATDNKQKAEDRLMDRATDNLLRALKKDMLQKEGRVNTEKLRKDGYSERLIARLENA